MGAKITRRGPGSRSFLPAGAAYGPVGPPQPCIRNPSSRVRATDTTIEPTHPSWLEKKANTPEHRQMNPAWL